MPNTRLTNVVFSLALVLMLGWLLIIGRGILLPVFTAVISVYVLNTGAAALGRQPLLGRLPAWVLRMALLIAFTLAILGIVLVVTVTVDQLIAVAPTYQANLEALLGQTTRLFGFQTDPTWEEIRAATVDRMNMQELFRVLLASLTSFGSSFFLVVVYAGFLMSERSTFPRKLEAAFPADSEQRLLEIITDINRRIGDYLAIKTLINVILGTISFAILWWMKVDFALFWAVLIGLFNYIPYLGSMIGVAFPVILSLAQFGHLPETLLLLALLSAAQIVIGNFLDPRMVGRQVNISPFVVLLALSFWVTVWGIPGAILAVPLTSMIAIICAAFPATRFVAVLLADRVGDADADITRGEGTEPETTG